MAFLVGIAGAVVGNALFGSAAFLGMSAAQWGFMIGSMVGSMLFAPKAPPVEGPRLTDLSINASTYGEPIRLVYGTMRVPGAVIWGRPIKEVRIEEEQGGKKGGKGSQTVVRYEYYADFAVAFCEGPILGYRRIWADTKLIYETKDDSSPEALAASFALSYGEGNVKEQVRGAYALEMFKGTEDQEPSPHIESFEGVGNVPAYRGTAYVVFNNLPLKDYGNRIPRITAEVVVATKTVEQDPPYKVMDWPMSLTSPHIMADAPLALVDNLLYAPYVTATEWRVAVYTLQGDLVEDKPIAGLPSGGQWFGHIADRPEQGLIYNDASYYVHLLWSGSDYTFYDHLGNQIQYQYTGKSWPTLNGKLFLWGTWTSGEGTYTYTYNLDSSTVGSLGSGVYPDSMDNTVSWGGTFAHVRLAVDPVRGTMWIWGYVNDTINGQSWALAEYDENGRLLNVYPAPSLNNFSNSGSQFAVHDGKVWAILSVPVGGESGAAIYDPTTWPWTVVKDINSSAESFNTVHNSPLVMAAVDFDNDRKTDAQELWTTAELYGMRTQTLEDVFVDLCRRGGIPESRIDGSQLASKQVRGFAVTRQMPIRRALETLMQAYWFDVVESDGKIKAVLRGNPPVATVPYTDLAPAEPGAQTPDDVEVSRASELELPRRIAVLYLDADKDYEQGEQHQQRIVTDSVSESTVELPLALTSQEAADIANVLLYDAWMARETYKLRLPVDYLYVDPADNITVELESGRKLTMRVTRMSLMGAWMEVEAARSDIAVYQPNAVAGDLSGVQLDSLGLLATTKLFLLDIPLLRDRDDNAGFYVAACPYSDSLNWPGAVLFVSDDKETYTQLEAVTGKATAGWAVNALGDGPTTVWDEGNELVVDLYSGAFYSATRDAVLNGANVLVVGNEVLQFADAYQNSDGTWTLRNFLRGRRGTEWATASHAVGERVVLMTAQTAVRVDSDLDLVGKQRYYKAPTIGQYLQNAAEHQFTNNAVGLKPYAPVHLSARYVGSNTWEVTWIRRTRIAGEWRDFVDVPLGEESEQYDVQHWRAGALVGSYTATSQSYTIVGKGNDTIKVAQVSAAVGAGYYSPEIELIRPGAEYKNAVLSDGPVAYWRLEEESGTTAFDEMGNYDGAYQGSILLRQAALINEGYSVYMDGAGDYISTSWYGVTGDTDRTVEAWVQVDDASTYRPIIVWGGGAAGAAWKFSVNNDSSRGVVGALILDVGNAYIVGTTDLVGGVHHIAAVLSGGTLNDVTLYVDGVAESLSGSSNVSQSINTTQGLTVTIGRFYNSATNTYYFFKGYIDEVSVYDKALAASRISAHYNAGL